MQTPLPTPDQAGESHFWVCGVQQHPTAAAAAVSFTIATEPGSHRMFFPASKDEDREHSDEPGNGKKKKKNILFHVWLIGSSVPSPSPPRGYLWCVSWGFERAGSSHLHTITQLRRHQLLIIITMVIKANLITERCLALFCVLKKSI